MASELICTYRVHTYVRTYVCMYKYTIIIIASVGLLCASILPYCIVTVHKCVVLVGMVCSHFLRVYTLLLCPDRTKIFIRFPQTLFDIEDKYQLRKHELGV